MNVPPRSAKKKLAQTRISKTKKVAPKLKLWVEFDERVKFGAGRAHLLELIDQFGSIKNAVTRTGMSYRAAWGYLKELEGAAGFKFLERTPGSGPRSGARLTPEAKVFVRHYHLFRKRVERSMEAAFKSSFRPV